MLLPRLRLACDDGEGTDLTEVYDRLDALEAEVLEAEVEVLEEENASLVDTISLVADLSDYIIVDTSTDSVVFRGANVFIQSGSGYTSDNGALLGLGNLFIGYNEDTDSDEDQSGSHNLVVGDENSFTSYAGVVLGYDNVVSSPHSTVSGGRENEANGNYAIVVGGYRNAVTDGLYGAVLSGEGNDVSGNYATTSGGSFNVASGVQATVSGGREGQASAYNSAISGGLSNTASGSYSSVSGGTYNTASGEYDYAP